MSASRRNRFVCMIGLLAALGAPSLALGEARDPLYQRLVYEHGADEPVRNVAGVERQVATRAVEYAEFDGHAVNGYMARPAETDGPTPALLMVHAKWGLNEDTRAMARRLAANGYTALAVDLYEGETADTPERARSLMEDASNDVQRLERNLREGLLYLDLMPSTARVGSIGWCFGGGWSLQTALMEPELLDAAVIYYGEPITDAAALEPLSAPVLGHFGSEDSSIPPQRARDFEALLDELDKPHEIHLYEGAGHTFASPSGTNYAAEPAEQAWQRTLDFIERTLQPQEEEQDEPADSLPATEDAELASG